MWTSSARTCVLCALTASLAAVLNGQSAHVVVPANVAVEPAPPAIRWIDLVNRQRALAGLAPVSERTDWSTGASFHARYLGRNGALGHSEDPGNPWYTPEGYAAGMAGNVAGSYNPRASDAHAIESWMQAPFHAVSLLDPQLTQVGYGAFRDPLAPLPMAAVLDIGRGLSAAASVRFPVAWPGNDTSVTPPTAASCPPGTACHWGEAPSPIASCRGYTLPAGLPLILQIGAGALVPSVTASSLRRDGAPIEHCVIDETRYTNVDPDAQRRGRAILATRDAIVIIPRSPLPVGSRYDVSVTANGSVYRWSFGVVAPACSATLGSASATALPAGGNIAVDVAAPAGCAWTVVSGSSWIAPSFVTSQGSGTLILHVGAAPAGQTRSGSVTIAGQTFTVVQGPSLAAAPSLVRFTSVGPAAYSEAHTAPQTVTVTTGGAATEWTATTSAPWVSIGGGHGRGDGVFTVAVTPGPDVVWSRGIATATVQVVAAGASNSPLVVPVTVVRGGTSAPPFGAFETPGSHTSDGDGAALSGSVAVTGWALDDVEVKSVQIWRDAHPRDPAAAISRDAGPQGGKIFVGDASFVSAARPDVEAAFPAFPLNYRAGWGYLMLTRGLVWDGGGAFRLYAVARDAEGQTSLLGSSLVRVANAASRQPFGAIDTPGAGEVVSGCLALTGWVLTPNPGATIPAGGVRVAIDGILLPRIPSMSDREDITSGFAEFDTRGAGRGLFIDTTAYANGVHTVAWLVTDSTGRTEGIGSRFVTVRNDPVEPRGCGN